jgi:hypothetical protein
MMIGTDNAALAYLLEGIWRDCRFSVHDLPCRHAAIITGRRIRVSGFPWSEGQSGYVEAITIKAACPQLQTVYSAAPQPGHHNISRTYSD